MAQHSLGKRKKGKMVATHKEPARAKESLKKVADRLRFRRFSTVQLLIALALFFICAPFVEEIKGGHLILSFLFSLVLLAAVLAVADRKRVLVIALVLAIPGIAGRWINHLPAGPGSASRLSRWRPHPDCFCSRAIYCALFLRAPSVTLEVLCASISAYLMLGLMWTLAYWLVDRLTPGGAFSFNTNAGRALNERVQWLLLQLHNTEHSRLR